MNRRLIARVVGLILGIEALCMLPSLAIALFVGGPDVPAFCWSIVLCAGMSALLLLVRQES